MRAALEQGLRHRWLGLMLVLALAVLLTLLVLHAADETLASGLVACAVLALLVAARELPVPLLPVRPGTRRAALRAPPLLRAVTPASAWAHEGSPPLRL